MDTLNIILMILLAVCNMDFINASSSCQQFEMKIKHLNKRLISHTLDEMIVPGHHRCARECMSFKVCKSIDYFREENKCKLNDVDSSSLESSEFEHKHGSVFSDITEWPSEMFGGCSTRPCTEKQKCHRITGSYICTDIECNVMDMDIPNGTLVVDPKGDTATVKCHKDHWSMKDKVECTIPGKWETAFCEGAINVAFGKNTTSSSVHNNKGPALGVDGNKMTYFHTALDPISWWRVDLGSMYKVFNVSIYNRMEGASERANGLKLKLGNSLDTMVVMGQIGLFPMPLRILHLPENTLARHVQLEVRNNFLHLREVEIAGIPA